MKFSGSNKSILAMAAPIWVALLIPQLNFFTNTAFVGRIGERELAINGISGIFYLILVMVGYGLASGLQIQLSRRSGEGDTEGVMKLFANGLLLSIAFSLVLLLLALWLAPIIFPLSMKHQDLVLPSINFLYIRVWGLPFVVLSQLLNAFYVVDGRSKYLVIGTAVATILNIVLDYGLIFGHFGLPKLGLIGAAVASVIAEAGSCAVLVGLFYLAQMHKRYPIRRYLTPDWELMQRTLKVSSPLIVQYFFSIGGWQVFFIFVEHLGERELAASQILRSVFGIVGSFTWAFATTCNTMVSNIIGQARLREVMPLIRRIALLSLCFTVVISGILMLGHNTFLSLYRDDPTLIAFSLPSLYMILAATLVMSVATVAFNGVVGTGNTRINLIIEITCVMLYLVYCEVVIERWHSPLHWAWGSEFVYWTTLLLIATGYLMSGKWMGKKV